MRDVRHACRAIVADGLEFFLVLMRTHDHDVRTNVEFLATAVPRFVWNPRADVHVSDADGGNVRSAAGETVFHPLHEDGIETAGLIVHITGHARQTRPFI